MYAYIGFEQRNRVKHRLAGFAATGRPLLDITVSELGLWTGFKFLVLCVSTLDYINSSRVRRVSYVASCLVHL